MRFNREFCVSRSARPLVCLKIMPPRYGSTVGFLVKDADEYAVNCAGYVLKALDGHCVIACAEVGGVKSFKAVWTAVGRRVYFVKAGNQDLVLDPPWASRCGIQGLPELSELRKLFTEQGATVSDEEAERMETGLSSKECEEIAELMKRLAALVEKGRGRPPRPQSFAGPSGSCAAAAPWQSESPWRMQAPGEEEDDGSTPCAALSKPVGRLKGQVAEAYPRWQPRLSATGRHDDSARMMDGFKYSLGPSAARVQALGSRLQATPVAGGAFVTGPHSKVLCIQDGVTVELVVYGRSTSEVVSMLEVPCRDTVVDIFEGIYDGALTARGAAAAARIRSRRQTDERADEETPFAAAMLYPGEESSGEEPTEPPADYVETLRVPSRSNLSDAPSRRAAGRGCEEPSRPTAQKTKDGDGE